MKGTGNEDIKTLSRHLFWDININALDVKKSRDLIIERIVMYGTENDERKMYQMYSLREIKKSVKNIEHMNLNALSYLSLVLGIKKEKFKCYGKTQSHRLY